MTSKLGNILKWNDALAVWLSFLQHQYNCFAECTALLWFCRYHPTAEPQYRLVKTPLSQRLAQDVQVFVDNFNCIPAFTANHTMTLFQQTTNT
jgi:hypothetical protein